MLRLPIDTDSMLLLASGPAGLDVDFATKAQKLDDIGRPLFGVGMVVMSAGAGHMITVKVAGPRGRFTVGQVLTVTDMVATPRSIGERSCIGHGADTITTGRVATRVATVATGFGTAARAA